MGFHSWNVSIGNGACHQKDDIIQNDGDSDANIHP